MTVAYGSPPGMAGKFHYGNRGLGVLGSQISADGLDGPSPFYACLEPGDDVKEIFIQITSGPSAGTLRLTEDGLMQFDGTGVPDGVYPVEFIVKEAGIDKGAGTFYITVGAGGVTSILSGGITLGDVAASGGGSGPGPVLDGNADLGSVGAIGGMVSQDALALILKILSNRQELDPVQGTFTLYDDDGTPILLSAAAWENAEGTVPYRGQALARIDRLQ